MSDEARIHSLTIKFNSLNILAESVGLSEEESRERMDIKKTLLELENLKWKDLKQKSRSRWALEGDENTSFFHGIINARMASNRIHGINTNGCWCSNPDVIKSEAYPYL
ncbi:hypothetical protein QVD17_21174 [Tagetes erecta]|uniref:Uncharacterized protein n=1 Tax=Tagetes erecta TaxID=13708 RepID=A0AAD8KQI1_TARER|nr:hypothetical protein QVD17_21174 [Tagetes erecta]